MLALILVRIRRCCARWTPQEGFWIPRHVWALIGGVHSCIIAFVEARPAWRVGTLASTRDIVLWWRHMAITRCVSSKRHGTGENMATTERRWASFRAVDRATGLKVGRRLTSMRVAMVSRMRDCAQSRYCAGTKVKDKFGRNNAPVTVTGRVVKVGGLVD